MITSEDRRRAFDEVADLYDQFRPSYPPQVVDDVVASSGVPPRGDVLEIGCGTGQATVPFAKRGYTITCLEPGPNLARIAARNLAAFPNVRIEVWTFEEWFALDSSFDLITAAQSFHLVDAAVSVPKAARLLRPRGSLAIFRNQPLRGSSELSNRIQGAYELHAPSIKAVRQDTWPGDTSEFDTVFTAEYPWEGVYSAAEYVGLMETQSPHRLLRPEQRSALLNAIREAIISFGGSITVEYVAQLWLGTRRAA